MFCCRCCYLWKLLPDTQLFSRVQVCMLNNVFPVIVTAKEILIDAPQTPAGAGTSESEESLEQ